VKAIIGVVSQSDREIVRKNLGAREKNAIFKIICIRIKQYILKYLYISAFFL
jgi:hypothetical protein